MGSRLDRDPFVQRSKGKATRRWSAGCKVRQRFLCLYEIFLVSTFAGRRPGSLSVICEHVVIGEMNVGDDKPDARSWRKAYGLALSLFAVEVVLLYLFTVRVSCTGLDIFVFSPRMLL